MSKDSTADPDRWEELQIVRLLFGLTPDEQAEYDQVAPQMPAEKSDLFDRLVAAVDVAWSDPDLHPLPEHLRRAIRLQAEQELTSQRAMLPQLRLRDEKNVVRSQNLVPWLVAAACAAISVFTWVSNRPMKNATPEIAQLRAELIASTKDLIQANWSAGPTPIAGAAGDVVWSSQRQQGFMRFRGLPVNVPTDEQYQLWIFDKNQSDKAPIDGGVFDIRTDEEAIVPIDAKLQVREAFLFAVTIEKPGGVVVSSRERLPLLAKVE